MTKPNQVENCRTTEHADSLLRAPLYVAGAWLSAGLSQGDVLDPASEKLLGHYAIADKATILQAVAVAEEGFQIWRKTAATERGRILIEAAALIRARCETMAHTLTRENGKPLAEARAEVLRSADNIEWYGQEAGRIYGRVLPGADAATDLVVRKEPIGPVAAFTPWNFPLSQSSRKLGAALAAGCSVILKGAEDTPFCGTDLLQAFIDAGVPAPVLQLLYGNPAMISEVLIARPQIRKVSFTGSVPVGRLLASAAGNHLKYSTMELGGHAPVLVFADAPVNKVIASLVPAKYRNSGQVCVSPTRILVEKSIFTEFTAAFKTATENISVGNGLHQETDMGPLIHQRHLQAITALVEDAVEKGATLVSGGKRIERDGYFFAPTILCNVPLSARIMNEEPFGPVAIINSFNQEEEAIAEANRLPYGLAAYLYTTSYSRTRRLTDAIESGMISVNGQPIALPDAPFGGIKDSGFGREGGIEGLEEYLVTKFIAAQVW
ncbi:NAD-dependent succinate-semialdehyde dehydrogenase [Erwiniaceae bacterium BAC15a-03b]|uniref:NAD-dependent succinate-semialdehyde dehydrogenase n=1 Tax=Winslowiella arboricola TaxID=2978220 RepID=A0A9J6PSM6_9GAMM|nr:NAD-dependent succinate-semialdehyde dehydrogenase [Winslowiella arboricola]MCU5775448.1 NAD-dependent succinate-semialdehyde dehydrogenase [Winslowiella arboricola]MCU5779702.1 NAD-dependent succinate-semialdehyde dehydrogenase [Winslowiella arboricola]